MFIEKTQNQVLLDDVYYKKMPYEFRPFVKESEGFLCSKLCISFPIYGLQVKHNWPKDAKDNWPKDG